MRLIPLVLIFVAAGGSRAEAQHTHPSQPDSALQARGRVFMGVDQYTSTHVFDDLADGGRIELQRDVDDSTGVAAIREHLQSIARAFKAGDFAVPGLVHVKDVPGTNVMADLRAHITWTFRPLPRGGEVLIHSADAAAVRAIHEFLAFQRAEHHAAGKAVEGHKH